MSKNIKAEGEKLHSAFERLMLEREALQQRLTVQDQRVDELEGLAADFLKLADKGSDLPLGFGANLLIRVRAAINRKPETDPASDRGHCKSCAIEYSAANHPACPICTRTTEAGDIWPAVTP